MSSRHFILVYVTTKDRDEARKIANAVMTQKLAACANITPSIESVYWWKGKLESTQEALLTFKTRAQHWPMIQSVIKKNHSYDIPCILSFPFEDGEKNFLAWITNQLGT